MSDFRNLIFDGIVIAEDGCVEDDKMRLELPVAIEVVLEYISVEVVAWISGSEFCLIKILEKSESTKVLGRFMCLIRRCLDAN